MQTVDLVTYYSNLLIKQYANKPKAIATVKLGVSQAIQPTVSTQTISFSAAPTSGTFVLSYNGNNTAAINWNDSVGVVQTKLQAVSGLSAVTVSGSISSLILTVTFTGVTPPAALLSVYSNTTTKTITIAETDVTLPFVIQNAFDLDTAQGVQLDVLGKYAGVVRSFAYLGHSATLNDSDFRSVIKFAIITNTSDGTLYSIVTSLYTFFPGLIYCFDHSNMTMSYYTSTSIGSSDFLISLLSQNLIPRPMGVQIASLIYYPTINLFFGFRTYTVPMYNATPFNNYSSVSSSWVWLSYAFALT